MTLNFDGKINQRIGVAPRPPGARRKASSQVAMPPELAGHLRARERHAMPARRRRLPWAGMAAMAGGLGGLVFLAHLVADVVLPTPVPSAPELTLLHPSAPIIGFSRDGPSEPSAPSLPREIPAANGGPIPDEEVLAFEPGHMTTLSGPEMTVVVQTSTPDLLARAPEVGTLAELGTPSTPPDLSAALAVVADPPVLPARPAAPTEGSGFSAPAEQHAPPPAAELAGSSSGLAALNDPAVPSAASGPVSEQFMHVAQHAPAEPALPTSAPAFPAANLSDVLRIDPPAEPAYTSPSTTMPEVQTGVPPLSITGPATDMMAGLDLPRLPPEHVAPMSPVPDEPVASRQPVAPLAATDFTPPQPVPAQAKVTAPVFRFVASRNARPPPPRPDPPPAPETAASLMASAPPARPLERPGPYSGTDRQTPAPRPTKQSTRPAGAAVPAETDAPAVFAEIAMDPGSVPFSPASVIARRGGRSDQGTLAGVFSTGANRWALVRLRDGRVLQIEAGDRIGPALAVAIEASGVVLDIDGARSLLRVGMQTPTVR